MISRLKQRANGRYYCSNCMLMQPNPPKTNCCFCGNWFENYENIIIKEHIDKTIEEVKSNEDNIHGRT